MSHHMNFLARWRDISSTILTGSRNSPTIRSATDRDNIRMHSGLRKRELERMDTRTNRFPAIITIANKMNTTMMMVMWGLRINDTLSLAGYKFVPLVWFAIEKLNSIFKESLLIQRSAPRCVIECHGGNNAIIFQEKANERSGILWKIEIH